MVAYRRFIRYKYIRLQIYVEEPVRKNIFSFQWFSADIRMKEKKTQ